ncbi:MAG: amidohydrolase family protein [Promicromonosporaceae bacterium]|nr:amidohydrolase family protein [Promicromonosporaceae bacterium]
MRVDAHHHVWDLAVRPQPWTDALPALRWSFGMDELRPQLRAAGVDATVVVQTVTVAEETPELLALAEQDPDVAGVVGWVDLADPAVADRIAALRSGPGGGRLVGVRHQVQHEPDPRWLLRPAVRRGLRAVAEAGLAYDVLVTHDQLAQVVEVSRLEPGVRFVLDHAGKPPVAAGALEPWRAHLVDLARSPNVTVKLSGLLAETAEQWSPADLEPYAAAVLDAFGPGRVLAGSDWPVCTLRADYAAADALLLSWLAPLDPDERNAVLGGNAAAVYRLDLPEDPHRG